jgi:hypothetical protein
LKEGKRDVQKKENNWLRSKDEGTELNTSRTKQKEKIRS